MNIFGPFSNPNIPIYAFSLLRKTFFVEVSPRWLVFIFMEKIFWPFSNQDITFYVISLYANSILWNRYIGITKYVYISLVIWRGVKPKKESPLPIMWVFWKLSTMSGCFNVKSLGFSSTLAGVFVLNYMSAFYWFDLTQAGITVSGWDAEEYWRNIRIKYEGSLRILKNLWTIWYSLALPTNSLTLTIIIFFYFFRNFSLNLSAITIHLASSRCLQIHAIEININKYLSGYISKSIT